MGNKLCVLCRSTQVLDTLTEKQEFDISTYNQEYQDDMAERTRPAILFACGCSTTNVAWKRLRVNNWQKSLRYIQVAFANLLTYIIDLGPRIDMLSAL